MKVLRKLTNEIVPVLSSLKSCGNQMRLPGTGKKQPCAASLSEKMMKEIFLEAISRLMKDKELIWRK